MSSIARFGTTVVAFFAVAAMTLGSTGTGSVPWEGGVAVLAASSGITGHG